MDDGQWLFLGILVVAALIAGAIKALWLPGEDARATAHVAVAHRYYRAAEIRALSERRALELLVEFPRMSDEQIALLMHDELMNRRAVEPEWFRWAAAETVGRMRRTIIVEIARQNRQ